MYWECAELCRPCKARHRLLRSDEARLSVWTYGLLSYVYEVGLTNNELSSKFHFHSFEDVSAVLEARAHRVQRRWRIMLDFGCRPSRRRVETHNEHMLWSHLTTYETWDQSELEHVACRSEHLRLRYWYRLARLCRYYNELGRLTKVRKV